MSIPSSVLSNLVTIDLEDQPYSKDLVSSLFPETISFDLAINSSQQFDLLYDLMTYDRFAVRDAFPFLNHRAPKRTAAQVEVFEDMELVDAPDLSPLPEIEMTYAKEFPSFFGQPK
jgi:hypothetical protein